MRIKGKIKEIRPRLNNQGEYVTIDAKDKDGIIRKDADGNPIKRMAWQMWITLDRQVINNLETYNEDLVSEFFADVQENFVPFGKLDKEKSYFFDLSFYVRQGKMFDMTQRQPGWFPSVYVHKVLDPSTMEIVA